MKTIIQKILASTSLNEQEAWWMLQHIIGKTRATLLHEHASNLSEEQLQTIDLWIQKLSTEFMPLSYLLGSVPFLDLMIKVQAPILIPRPETEEWVAILIQELQPHASKITTILEIGTGSGCIALALGQAFTHAAIIAVDINPAALKLAQENADLNKITNVTFIKSDLFSFSSSSDVIRGSIHPQSLTFDLIVSNPPYISTIHKKTMMPQVLQWEDEHALFAQDNGLHLIKEIIKQAPQHLRNNPSMPYQLVLEHDNGQQDTIKKIAQENGFDCTSKKDLFQNYRTSWCKLSNCKITN